MRFSRRSTPWSRGFRAPPGEDAAPLASAKMTRECLTWRSRSDAALDRHSMNVTPEVAAIL